MAEVWVKNLESGLLWEVDEDQAKYLFKQQNSDGEPLFQKARPPVKPTEGGQAAAGATGAETAK